LRKCILVVNNNSTDGTKEWLDNQKDLTVIHQENLGGAGGFHNGIKTAYEKGNDWIWCMDDDCCVKSDSLDNLIKVEQNRYTVYNCLSLDPFKNELAFYLKEKDSEILNKYSEIKDRKIIEDASFFNGTLISKEVINSIGLPIAEMYFRGDEVEYKLRVTQKYKVHTIVDSIIYHPPEVFYEFRCFWIKHIYIQMSALKKYYYHRNTVYIYRKYKNRKLLGMIKNALFDSFCAMLKLKEYKITLSVLKGFFSGFLFNPSQKELFICFTYH